MNTTFESAVQTIPYSGELVYELLSDFNNFGNVVQNERITDWRSTADTCYFKVEGMGEVGLRIVERNPFQTIKYTAEGKTPFNFYLWVQLNETESLGAELKLTIKADMNPMIKMVAGGPVQKFLDTLAETIARHRYL